MPSTIRSIQAPAAVVMIRPHRFTPNPETAADNAFQTAAARETAQAVTDAVYREVTAAVERLEAEGVRVRVHLFDDRGEHDTPDSVFPNNWLSTHPGGHVAIYPMHSPSRRRERLQESGREVIALTARQIAEFAGNAIELSGSDGRVLALSQRACDSLTGAQKAVIERSARLVPLSVPTIEMAGGSVRCMIAGIHLSPRNG
jgi:hypothetical protein